MRALLAVTVLALLSGCLAKDAPGATSAGAEAPLEDAFVADAPEGAAALPAAPAEAPVWLVGDAWSVTTFGGGSEERAAVVVTKADTESYVLETTSEQLAAYDAMNDISFLGRIRARDLAGFQQDAPIQFFDFPLADGKTWTTQWDMQEITLRATKAGDGFSIVGTSAEEAYVTYDYKPALKWWSKIEFAGGYGLRVDRFSPNWTGALATATAATVYESTTAIPTLTINTDQFTVSEGQTFLGLRVHGGGPAWARALTLMDPANQPYMTTTSNTEATATPMWVNYEEQIPAMPGTWRISAPVAHAPDSWWMVHVQEVAVGTKPFPS